MTERDRLNYPRTLVVFGDGETFALIEDARIIPVTNAEYEAITTHGEKVRHVIDVDRRGQSVKF